MLILSLVASLALQNATETPLPRRGTLMIGLAPTAEGELAAAVFPDGSPAREAGMQAGDVLLAVDGHPVSNPVEFQIAFAGLPTDRDIDVSIRRNGEARNLSIRAVPRPEETIAGFRAEYSHVALANGDRVRTITLWPNDRRLETASGLPGVFYIYGIPCQSLDGLSNPGGSVNPLFRSLLEAGFAVSFADKPGIGDSEGESCITGGFDREVEAFSNAAAAFAAHPGIDAERLYGIGVSMGGFQIPLIADSTGFDGLITLGTGFQPWFDYMITNFRWRYQLEGLEADEMEQVLRLFRLVWAELLVMEKSAAQLREERPEAVAAFEARFGPLEAAFGRSVRFMQELDNAELWPAWADYSGALLAVHGEYDWVATETDHRMLAHVVAAQTERPVSFEILPGVDHVGTRHGTLAESFANRFNGEPDASFNALAVSWLTDLASPGEEAQ